MLPAPARFVAGRRMSVVRRAEVETKIQNGVYFSMFLSKFQVFADPLITQMATCSR